MESKDQVPVQAFCDGCNEVKKIVYTLGAAFSLASNDISLKTGITQKHADEYKDILKPSISLQSLVLHEMELKLERTGDTGAYVSAARSLVRLLWFLDYVSLLLSKLLEAEAAADAAAAAAEAATAAGAKPAPHKHQKELRECASEAYEAALAPRHPWILRKTIGAAMYLLPSRHSFLESLASSSKLSGPAELKPQLRAFLDMMEPLRVHLWDFFTSKGIADLP